MHPLFLAFRYLWTRPLSWVSLVGIWLSVTATIATVALMSGYIDETRRTILGTTGDLVLSPHPTYYRDLRMAPPGFAHVSRVLAERPGVTAMTPHLLRPAFAQREDDESGLLDDRNLVLVTGLDPATEGAVTRFPEYVARVPARSGDDADDLRVDDPARPFWIDPARFPAARAADAELPVALLGVGLFHDLEVRKGDVLLLATLPEDAVSEEDVIEPRTARVVVGGAVKTGHFEHDAKSAFVDIHALQAFARSSSDASEICVKVADGADPRAVLLDLERAAKEAGLPIGLATSEDRNMSVLGPVRNQRSILMVIMLFFVLVACFNVFATLTILVTDKVRDIGLLTAMGSTPLGVSRVFTACGFLLSAAGGALGAVTGVAVAHRMNWLNDTIERLTDVRIFRASIYTFDQIPITVEGWFVATVLVSTVLFAVVCAFVPALRAGRMDPVEALRYE